jgi:hypothetical protein
VLDGRQDRAAGIDRAHGVVLARDERDEQGHHAVTEELVYDPAVGIDGRAG